jgi:D-glycero-D-manno-heptose 1,7-bisphosphate phosphatase
MHPAIFLDRDGVIVENRDEYIRRVEEVVFLPQALEALARISASPYRIVIITNQSAVGRGIIALQAAEEINRFVIERIQQAGGRIDGVFMCPHAPEAACPCRKPQPGLIVQAARDLLIDPAASVIIGDALTDLLAGQAAGVRQRVLVRTGRGAQQAGLPPPAGLGPYRLADSLSIALDEVIQGESTRTMDYPTILEKD